MNICQICQQREAKIHITELDKNTGKLDLLDICVECSVQTGLLPSSGPVTLRELLQTGVGEIRAEGSKIYGGLEIDVGSSSSAKLAPVVQPSPPAVPCPVCEITFDEIKSSGRFGCDHDYTTFQDEVEPLLRKLHGNVQHSGKVPANLASMRTRQARLRQLKSELEDAIVLENYEEAARLRDAIRDLEGLSGEADNGE